MATARERYAAFSDESRHSDGRFRSIASVSMPFDLVLGASDRIKAICHDSNVRELKWQKLVSARDRFCALKIIDYLCTELIPRGVRVDVLVWDTCDSRHQVLNRDDSGNYERMFFHLHRKVMEGRAVGAEWHLRPDEQVNIQWDKIHSCLRNVGRRSVRFEHPLFDHSKGGPRFEVRTFRQVISSRTPLCQVADLFAGLTPYTCEKAEIIRKWLRAEGGRQAALSGFESDLTLSSSDRERIQVLDHLYKYCLRYRLGVSLKTEGRLRSRRASGPLNFWHYEPQHPHDRAPIRPARRS